VEARAAAGDARISFIDTTSWLTPADLSDRVHPNLPGSEKIRDRLSAELQKLL
jgi:hypothetical protein